MEDFLLGSAKDNSAILVSALISVGVIKASDFAGRQLGLQLKRRIKSGFLKYMLYFTLLVAILAASKFYYASSLKPNLFRKYNLTRFSQPEEIRNLYRTLARQSHPDMRGSRSDFANMNAELKALMTDRQRWFYDRFGHLSEASPSEVQSEQISYTISIFMDYLSKALFVIVFVQNELNLNTRMSALCLVLLLLLYDIYNITARRPTSKDPLDFIFYDFTLYERSSILREMFTVLFFLLITYKFAFEEAWAIMWLELVNQIQRLHVGLVPKLQPVPLRQFLLQANEIDAYKRIVIQSMQITFNSRKPVAPPAEAPTEQPQEQPAEDTQSQANGQEWREARIFGETDEQHDGDLRDRTAADSIDRPARPQNYVPEPQEQQEANDPRDASLWSMVVSLLKGVATFYAINTAIKYLTNL